MSPKNKERLICGLLFVAGIAFCGAGFVMPPMAILGAGFLAGALTVLANILQDKDRIVVNNNYTVAEPLLRREEPKPGPVKEKPSIRLKSFFGFKNKKFMKRHEEALREEHGEPAEVEELESNSMQLPKDILEELNKLDKMLKGIDMELISKVAREFEQKSHDPGNPNR